MCLLFRDVTPHAASILLGDDTLISTAWLEKNKDCASYDHFDYKVSLSSVINDISNPEKVSKHSFKPFIHFIKRYKKYNNNTNQTTIKERHLNFTSHYDRCIFQYYSYLIDEKYNEYVKMNNE